MLKRTISFALNSNLHHLCKGRFSKISYKIAPPKPKWDLATAVCIERKPVITKELNELEKEYKKMLAEIEFEGSLKSDHEMRHEKEVKQLKQLQKGVDVDAPLKQTAQDLLDAHTQELSQFKFGSRITEADRKNDLRSLQRKLDRHLVLVVQQQIGGKNHYLLPQAIRNEGETLRQTAERAVQETCGTHLKAGIYGNCPCSVYKYRYPRSLRENLEEDVVGRKVYIYYARYLSGDLPKDSGIDFKWLDRKELYGILPEQYRNSVLEMLIDED